MSGVDDFPLEPAVRRILRFAGRFDATDRTVPWRRRRATSPGGSRLYQRLVMPDGPEMLREADERVLVDGGRIDVRIYRPRPGRLPVHLFIHGGGWCTGTPDERDPRCRAIASGASCVVVSIDYRLSPENAFPTPLEDCYRVLEWVVEEADRLEIDPARIGVGGESAGANLAAVMCLLTRERGGPAIAYQWLDVPATDLTLEQPSVASTPKGFLLHQEDMLEYREAYLPPGVDPRDPHASPLHADDLGGLPPAWITTCGADPLRDDGRAYAERLREAGVPVEHRHLDGHIHASFAFTRIASSAAHERAAVAALGRALHARSPEPS